MINNTMSQFIHTITIYHMSNENIVMKKKTSMSHKNIVMNSKNEG